VSAYVDVDDYFKSTIAKDVAALLLGKFLGYGSSRSIFEHATDDSLIVKVEPEAKSFHNISEWQVWERVKRMKVSRWFAPVVDISPNGAVLVMKRCEPARLGELPARVPAFFTDLKAENWGLFEGRFVCLDYGNHLLFEHGMTKRMRKVDWT